MTRFAALAAAIRPKLIAVAAVDLINSEPPLADYPLLGLNNVPLTPHMGARLHTTVENMIRVVRDVVEAPNGRPATYPAP